MTLSTFLAQRKRTKNQVLTHTWFAAGSELNRTNTLHIPDNEVSVLETLLMDNILGTKHKRSRSDLHVGVNSISEKLVKDVPFRFVVDLDFKPDDIKTWANKVQISETSITARLAAKMRSIVLLCKATVNELTTSEQDMVVATRLPYKIHIHFPSVIVDSKHAKILTSAFVEKFKEHHADMFNPTVIDNSIYSTGLRLLYCHKGSMSKPGRREEERIAHEAIFGAGTYTDVYYVTDMDKWLHNEPCLQDLRKTTLRVGADPVQLTTLRETLSKPTRIKVKTNTIRAGGSGLTELADVDQHFFEKTGQLSDENLACFLANAFLIKREDIRFDERLVKGKKMIIPTRSRKCPFAEREHKGNQIYFIVSSKTAELRCHDADCKERTQQIPLTQTGTVSAINDEDTIAKRNDFIVKHVAAVQQKYPRMNLDIDPTQIEPSDLCAENGYIVPLTQNRFCGICQTEHERAQNCLMMLLREQRLLCKQSWKFERFPMGEEYAQVIFANVVNNQVNINVTNTNSVNTNEARDFGSFADFPNVHHNRELDRKCFLSLSGRTRDVAEYVSMLMKGHYLFQEKTWYRYTGKYWRESVGPDDLMTKDMIDTYMGLQQHFSSEKHRKWIFGLIDDLANVNRRKAYLEDLERYEFEHSDYVNLDGVPELLGFQNCVFDARDCTLRTHCADDYLTKLISYDLPAEPDFMIRAQIEQMFLDILPIDEVREFVLLMLCLHLEGFNRHDIAMIWVGVGGNGKTLLKNLMSPTFDIFHVEPPATFLTNERPSSDRPCPDLVGYNLCKSMFTSEPQSGKKINTGFVKFITGRDPIRVRNLNSSIYVEYTPRFLVTLLCNVVPLFEGGEDDGRGIWRRLKIIKFETIFTENPDPDRPDEKLVDRTLDTRIKGWGPEFMLMLIERFRRYVHDGRKIKVPDAVEKCLAEQKEENSPFDTWLSENLVKAPERKVHIHRFERAYAKTRNTPVRKGTVENALKARGYAPTETKLRDSGCCDTSNKCIVGADVRGWGE